MELGEFSKGKEYETAAVDVRDDEELLKQFMELKAQVEKLQAELLQLRATILERNSIIQNTKLHEVLATVNRMERNMAYEGPITLQWIGRVSVGLV